MAGASRAVDRNGTGACARLTLGLEKGWLAAEDTTEESHTVSFRLRALTSICVMMQPGIY